MKYTPYGDNIHASTGTKSRPAAGAPSRWTGAPTTSRRRGSRRASFAPSSEDIFRSSIVSDAGGNIFAFWSEREGVRCYLEESYRGAALVQPIALGGYLSKFAVTREAQGEGIGQDLWSALSVDYPALLWRARESNPIRGWYERVCQGRFAAGEWTVYFRGLRPEQIEPAIALALAQPVDF